MENELIISSIREGQSGRQKVINFLLSDSKFDSQVKSIVNNITGAIDNFQDIKNLTIVQLLKNVLTNKDFLFTTNLYQYLSDLTRYLTLVRMRIDSKSDQTLYEELNMISDQVTIDLNIVDNEKRVVVDTLLDKMDKKSISLLTYLKAGHSIEEIKELLGFSDSHSVILKLESTYKKVVNTFTDNPSFKAILE